MTTPATASEATSTSTDLSFRPPVDTDGKPIWQLVHESGELDLNSPYSYVLFCKHFRETCRVAVLDDELVGFIIGYRQPDRRQTLFVWQIGVSAAARGRRVANRMLHHLIRSARGVRYVEASVTPDNAASQALFRGFARDLETDVTELPFMSEDLFPGDHEAEILFRIGPFDPPADTTSRRA